MRAPGVNDALIHPSTGAKPLEHCGHWVSGRQVFSGAELQLLVVLHDVRPRAKAHVTDEG
jgi:hypothetical protein